MRNRKMNRSLLKAHGSMPLAPSSLLPAAWCTKHPKERFLLDFCSRSTPFLLAFYSRSTTALLSRTLENKAKTRCSNAKKKSLTETRGCAPEVEGQTVGSGKRNKG
jgi:hypothetical protein